MALYALVAAAVFFVHGPEPALMSDHLAYMKQVDDIVRAHPDGQYWSSVSQVHSYAVVIAYLNKLTMSSILSMKLLLAGMTVLSLLAFELLMTLATTTKWKAVLFTLLSAPFVTFGASFWGYTDFAAAVQRTAMIPFAVVIVWFWLAQGRSPLRFVVFPVLVAVSVVHLSAYYVAAVLGVLELWNWGAYRRFRADLELLWFASSLLAAQLVRLATEAIGLAFRESLRGLVFPTGTPLDPVTAWQIELLAFPWRNMPLPLTTLATIALSYGLIFMVALAGIVRARRGGLNELDRSMLALAGATVAFAYGPQTLLWIARQFTSVYPLSLEETRAVNLIMIPSMYFAYRLFDFCWSDQGRARSSAAAAAILALILLQPLNVLRAAPSYWKEGMLNLALDRALIRKDDSLRLLYAHQALRLPDQGPRFYYSALGVLAWLRDNACPHTRVISTLNELILADVETVGPFNGLLNKAVAAPERKLWADSVVEVNRAVATGNLKEVERVGQRYGAVLAVVPWSSPGAVYSDQFYSIVSLVGQGAYNCGRRIQSDEARNSRR